MKSTRISIIGAGAMGGAIARGLVNSNQYSGASICVSDPDPEAGCRLQPYGVVTTTDNNQAASQADVLMVVVKPWLVQDVLAGIKDALKPQSQVLVVVAAGVSSDSIRQWLGPQCPPLLLCIPNIAIEYMQSMTFLVNVTAEAAHCERVKEIFDHVGTTKFTDEQHLPSGTTLASCGIAYAMRYIRAAAEGGVELGFKARDAQQIVMQTVLGAVTLLEKSGLHPEEAIDQVTTPGGVTIKGLNEMEHAGFTSAVIRGLKAGAK